MFTAFLNASPDVLGALSHIGDGDEPSIEVVTGCEEFMCTVLCPNGVNIIQAKDGTCLRS